MVEIFCRDSNISMASELLLDPLPSLGAGPVRLSLRVITDKNDRRALHDEPNTEATCDEKSGRLLDFSRFDVLLLSGIDLMH